MKPKIKYRLAGLGLALSCLLASPTFAADFTGNCTDAQDPSKFDGNGNADITDGTCTISSLSATGYINISASGIVSIGALSAGTSSVISGTSIISTGPIITNGGSLTLTSSSGSITTDALTSTYGGTTITSSGGAIATADITSYGGPLVIDSSDKLTINGIVQTDYDYISIKADSDIDVDKIYSGWKLDLVSTNGKIIADAGSDTADTLKVQNYGAMNVKAKTTLDIVGRVSSINGDITLESDDDITTKKVDSGNNLTITSKNGEITSEGTSDTADVLVADNYGSIKVKSKTDLTITGKTVARKWNVELQADDDVTANEVNAGASMKIVSINGKIDIKDNDLKANTEDVFGNMLLVAKETIATKNLMTKGSAKTGGIEIQANKGTTPVPFIVGGTGNDNGVNGTIDTTSANGGGTDPTFISGGIFITNGASGSTGDITITGENDIKVQSSASRSGLIILDAREGKITVPGGNALNSDGGTGGAGEIRLIAKTVEFGADSVVSASQSTGATNHGIYIAAENVNFSGSSGLTLNADGDGYGTYVAHVAIYPKGSLTLTSTSNSSGTDYPYQYMYWSMSVSPQATALNLHGSGNSPLFVSASGQDTAVDIRSKSTKFTGGEVTVEAKGKTNHNVYLYDVGTGGGLSFSGSGAVTIDASASEVAGAEGGSVSVATDQLTYDGSSVLCFLACANHSIKANGSAAGTGNGGNIYVYSAHPAVIDPNKVLAIFADAAKDGNAIFAPVSGPNKKAIEFYPGGNVPFGTDPGQVTLSARGGNTGGNGGTIVISVNGATLETKNAIDASARSGDGNGGEVYFFNYITAVNAVEAVLAKGHGNGLGGKFTAFHNVNTFNVHAVVKVDGGDTLGTSDSDGSIKLNNIECQQWQIGGTSFPGDKFGLTYWNCLTNNARSTGLPVGVAAYGLPTGLKALLGNTLSPDNKVVQIHTMEKYADYSSFFGRPNNFDKGKYGVTYVPMRVSVSFANVLNSAGGSVDAAAYSGSPTIMAASMVHELGHELDYIWGFPSTQAAFTSLAGPDYRDLHSFMNEYPAVGGIPASPRPCSDVFDATSPFCASLGTMTLGEKFDSEYGVSAVFGAPPLIKSEELFCFMFEHILNGTASPAYSADPWLEMPLNRLPGMQSHVQGLISAPPAAVN